MQYRTLGRTGITVSQMCLGAMMFGAFGNPDHDHEYSHEGRPQGTQPIPLVLSCPYDAGAFRACFQSSITACLASACSCLWNWASISGSAVAILRSAALRSS